MKWTARLVSESLHVIVAHRAYAHDITADTDATGPSCCSDVLLEKHYKGIISRGSVEYFWEEVSKKSKRDVRARELRNWLQQRFAPTFVTACLTLPASAGRPTYHHVVQVLHVQYLQGRHLYPCPADWRGKWSAVDAGNTE